MLNSNILIKLVIFRVHNHRLEVLLEDTSLPGNSLVTTMPLDTIAASVFVRCTGLALGDHFLEQLYTFSTKQEVSVSYYVLVGEELSLQGGFVWVPVAKFTEKVGDQEIVQYAVQRLAWKVEYTNVVYSLLPPLFTLTQLQEVYEIVLGHKIDKRNFRKKIISLDFIEPTGERRLHHARPAQIYRFKKRQPTLVKVFS